ncbi:MAG: hypothetical protein OXB95_14250 [Rhodobacteraceae bacterium]|nr:hypothetical protein [Paracoccaceae bacterium]
MSLSILLAGCVPATQETADGNPNRTQSSNLAHALNQPQKPGVPKNSNLTQGNVQLHLEVGKTTKAEVLEVFGAPNITTRDSRGNEVWSYQRSAQVSQASAQTTAVWVVVVGQSASSSGFETSSRMTTLIIEFDSRDVVVDFKSRTSNF